MASAHAAFAGGDCEIPRDLRVLVVDDDALCRMVVQRKLEHLKYLGAPCQPRPDTCALACG